MNFKFEEALIFLSFVQVSPTNENHEELLYRAIEEKIGITQESFEKVRKDYKKIRSTLTQNDVNEYKLMFNEFEKEKNDATQYFRHEIIDEKTQIYDILQTCNALVEKVNRKNRGIEKTMTQMHEREVLLEVKMGTVKENTVVSKKEKFFQSIFKR